MISQSIEKGTIDSQVFDNLLSRDSFKRSSVYAEIIKEKNRPSLNMHKNMLDLNPQYKYKKIKKTLE